MNAVRIAAVVGVVAALVGGGFMFLNGNGSATGQIVADTFSLSTGDNLEVMEVEDMGSIDKVTVRRGDQLQDYYITEDGQYIVQNFLDVKNFTSTVKARNDFISCLSDDNAGFYGLLGNLQTDNQQTQQLVTSAQQAAQAQIQILGGATQLQDVFLGPGNATIQQQLLTLQAQGPAVIWSFDGRLQAGIQTIQQIEDATGCTYNPDTQ